MESDFVRFLVNVLRKGSIQWPGRAEALRRSRKQKKIGTSLNGKPKLKYFWQCAKCLEWFRDQRMVEVDHIQEIGRFNGCWNEYIARMFCGQDNLQVICQVCHLKKTMAYNSARGKWSRKSRLKNQVDEEKSARHESRAESDDGAELL